MLTTGHSSKESWPISSNPECKKGISMGLVSLSGISQNQSALISINQHQSASICINQHQSGTPYWVVSSVTIFSGLGNPSTLLKVNLYDRPLNTLRLWLPVEDRTAGGEWNNYSCSTTLHLGLDQNLWEELQPIVLIFLMGILGMTFLVILPRQSACMCSL